MSSPGAPRQANEISADSTVLKKPRSRVLVACDTCRERRTRCVILHDGNKCIQCQFLGCRCVFRNTDERRKPSSKAYVNSLNVKIAALEKNLAEKDQALHPETNAPVPVTAGLADQPAINNGAFSYTESCHGADKVAVARVRATDARQPSSLAPKDQGLLDQLLSMRSQHRDRPNNGRLNLFGPTASCHVFLPADFAPQNAHKVALEQDHRAQRVISTLSQETHDYLLQLFWEYHNSIIPIVHREAFEEGRCNGRGLFYSGVLHVCLLAAGFRYADRNRPDICKISISQHESMLHMEAKFMVDSEGEQPVTLPSIASFLLLGDLEHGVGRDNMGWRYVGLANRSCCEIGLHITRHDSEASSREVELEHMILGACIMHDRYWALFLGRPTSLKVDVTLSDLQKRVYNTEQLHQEDVQVDDLEARIHKSHMGLMEITVKITEIVDQTWKFDGGDLPSYLYTSMACLNRESYDWYAQLPRSLKLTKDNAQRSPPSLFLLHQQYHVNMILLHLPFARLKADKMRPGLCEDLLLDESTVQSGDQFSSVSRAICKEHAVCTIQVIHQHRQRFKKGKVFSIGLHHVATAAIALLVVMGLSDAPLHANADNMRHLESAIVIIDGLSYTVPLAERMSPVLKIAVTELRERLLLRHGGRESLESLTAPRTRTAAEGIEQQQQSTKRRRISNRPQETSTSCSEADEDTAAGQSSPRVPSSIFIMSQTEPPFLNKPGYPP